MLHPHLVGNVREKINKSHQMKTAGANFELTVWAKSDKTTRKYKMTRALKQYGINIQTYV